jgi:hypothetical protein
MENWKWGAIAAGALTGLYLAFGQVKQPVASFEECHKECFQEAVQDIDAEVMMASIQNAWDGCQRLCRVRFPAPPKPAEAPKQETTPAP